MNVLVVGAAGHVGGILRPALEAEHTCRYLDIRPIEGAEDRTMIGSCADYDDCLRATEGMDACIQLAMVHMRHEERARMGLAYDVHVKGMALLLDTLRQQGGHRMVYASTLSVYERSRPAEGCRDETSPPDATGLYGLTKRLGDEVCKAFATRHPEFSILSLQMVLPKTDEQWAQPIDNPRADRNFMTGPQDLRRAYLNALAHPDHTGYDAVFICSDVEGKYLDLSKAARLLDWVPEGK